MTKSETYWKHEFQLFFVADAILLATLEHNYTVSAVLKNAIEWGNRPATDNSWEGKRAAIISVSTGPRGGARVQLHLRQIMVILNLHLSTGRFSSWQWLRKSSM